jgi:hypothetical protein
MLTQPASQIIQWQNLKVMSEVDLVLTIAQQHGWKDCKVFGQGNMITQPLESMGWKLIPADLYEYSIPAQGVERILQIVNAGIHIRGVIIADDIHKDNPPQKSKKPVVSLPSVKIIFTFIGRVLLGMLTIAVFLGLTIAAFSIFFAPVLLLILGTDFVFDPNLVILVDDGDGGTAWISVYTWYD